MELLRIIAMVMVLGLHCNFLALGRTDSQEFLAAPFATAWRMFLEYLCIVGVNVFVLISGFFGIRLTRKRLLHFIFYVLYWTIAVVGVLWLIDSRVGFLYESVSFMNFLLGLCEDGGLWFVWAYVVLMLLSVPLNVFIEKAPQNLQVKFLLIYFGFETLGVIYHGLDMFNQGYSALSFIGIYILGGLIRRNMSRFDKSAWVYFLYYIATVATMTLLVVLAIYIIHFPEGSALPGTQVEKFMMFYSSPVNILASALLLIAFAKLNFHSRGINYVAASAFGVYLLHIHPVVKVTYLGWCKDIFERYELLPYAGMVVATFAAIFLFVTIVDQVRKWLSRLLFR